MSAIFDAYNLPVSSLVSFYVRLNRPIEYPDGMVTTLGIVYWGRPEHIDEIGKAVPKLLENGIDKFSDILLAVKTPTRSRQFSERSGIPQKNLRVLKHDIEMWLPQPVNLGQLAPLQQTPACLDVFSHIRFNNQLDVISAGQTQQQRDDLSRQLGIDRSTVDDTIKLCDFYRTGKNLDHIRSRIYYAMGLDTWQKWAEQTSDCVIRLFMEYIKDHPGEADRLVPFPKEIRNGIEWAKRHLEIFTVEW